MQTDTLRFARRRVEDALDALSMDSAEGVRAIRKWTEREEKGGARGTAVLDVVYEITPSGDFCSEMIDRNQLRRNVQNHMHENKIALPPPVKS